MTCDINMETRSQAFIDPPYWISFWGDIGRLNDASLNFNLMKKKKMDPTLIALSLLRPEDRFEETLKD